MAWSAMADVPNPIFDANGDPYSGAVLKAYDPGTTDVTSIAIDASGSSPQTSITANASGIWEVSGNEIVPHINKKHKWGIFANSTDAAANTPFYMGPFDNIEVSSTQNLTVKTYETVSDMVAATDINIGDYVRTLGYLAIGDGGNNEYDIVAAATGTDDGGRWIDLATHQAKGLFPGGVYRDVQWGCAYDDSTDDATERQAAIDYLEANGGGVLDLGLGTSYSTAVMDVAQKTVSIRGQGGFASIISVLSDNGLNITSATNDGGAQFFEDFALVGRSGSTANWVAVQSILPSGGVSGTDSRDGLHFHRLRLYDWNQCFVITDTWEWTINKCKAQKVNQFVDLGAYAYVGRIVDNFCVFDSGDSHSGTANTYAIDFSGSTIEGAQIRGNQFFGFSRGISCNNAIYTNIIDNDILATQYCIYLATTQNVTNVVGNYCQVGANNAIGIYGPGLGSAISSIVNVTGNKCINTSFTGTVGIQVNESGTTNQFHWRISDNMISAMDDYDILVYNGGDTYIERNRCTSSGVTNSILVSEGSGQVVYVGNNDVTVAASGGTQTGTYTGTFTPVFADAATAGNTATATAAGYYTKQGPLVTVYLSLSSIDTTGMTGANIAYIRSLPYTARASTFPYTAMGSANVTIGSTPFFEMTAGQTYGIIRFNNTGAAKTTGMLVSAVTSGSGALDITFTYLTDQ